jgi:hypothetical protein
MRLVCIPLSAGIVIAFVVLAVAVTGVGWQPWHAWDMIWMIGIGVLLGGIGLRFGFVQAVPDAEGLTVRNVLRSRRLAWPQIIGASFNLPAGDPWVSLDLTDGTTVQVMGIQAADGARAQAEVRRLRELIARYG